jgi:hypothetical protein
MTDLLFQQLSTVQSNLQPNPPTIASAVTISPQTLVTFLTGTAQTTTINPPVSGSHMLILVFTNASPGAFLTTGNIKGAVTPAQNVPVLCIYDPVTALYWCGILKAS